MIRAYLWQAIIRLGFCPSSTKDQKKWLRQYNQSIKQFWEINRYPEAPSSENGRIKAIIDCTDLCNLILEYAIETMDKFIVRFLYKNPVSKQELMMWTHDVDEGAGKYFCFPVQPFLTAFNSEKIAIKSFDDEDIEVVTDGLLFHPKAHQHIESPSALDNHDIRIGGGIDNPFLYLFHLRYQFCPIPEKREMEKVRLKALFSYALKNKYVITADMLMAQPEF